MQPPTPNLHQAVRPKHHITNEFPPSKMFQFRGETSNPFFRDTIFPAMKQFIHGKSLEREWLQWSLLGGWVFLHAPTLWSGLTH
jgi:hypothetical protein